MPEYRRNGFGAAAEGLELPPAEPWSDEDPYGNHTGQNIARSWESGEGPTLPEGFTIPQAESAPLQPDAGGGSFAPYQSQPAPQAYQQVGMGSSPYGGAYTPQYRPVQQPPPSIGGLELHPSEVPLAQIHQQLAQASLSPADQLELERAQNALAGVRQQLASGEITPQDSFVMNQMIHDNAGNLMVRASMLPILQHRLQMQLLQQQLAHQAAAEERTNAFHATTLPNRLIRLNDEYGQPIPGQYYLDRHGEPHLLPTEAEGGRSAHQTQLAQEQAMRQHHDLYERTHNHVMSELRDYQTALNHWEAHGRAAGSPRPPFPFWLRDDQGQNLSTDEAVTQRVRYLIDRHYQESGRPRPNRPNAGGSALTGNAPPNATGTQNSPPPPPAIPQPFSASDPQSMTPAQRQIAEAVGQTHRRINEAIADHGLRQEAENWNAEALRLLEQYGGVAAMPAPQRARYTHLYERIRMRLANPTNRPTGFQRDWSGLGMSS